MTPSSSHAAGSSTDRLARAVERLADAWARGESLTADAILAEAPGEWSDDDALRLAFEEACLRREAGQPTDTAAVVGGRAHLAGPLRRLLEFERLMRPAVAEFPEPGERLGSYQLGDELGRGGAGRTYLATQPNLADRPVVVKVTALDQDEHLSLARLRHPHIVPLFAEQVIEDRGLRLLCMPDLGGATLGRVLEVLAVVPPARRDGRHLRHALDLAGRTPADLAGPSGPYRLELDAASYVHYVCWVGACLADALHAAHARGLVHMDVKPSNVLIAADGRPMLLDFHLARAPVSPGEFGTDRLGGTAGWMAPEQRAAMDAARDGRPAASAVDGRADIYALGLLLHEALGGPGAVADGVPRAPLGRLNPAVSTGLADIVARCLAPTPAGRYPDAAALADDLRRHLRDLPLKGVGNRSPLERWRKWRRRAAGRPSAWVGIAAVAAALLAGSAGSIYYFNNIAEMNASLAEGQRRIGEGQHKDALRVLQHGSDIARRTPLAGDLAAQLEAEARRAQRGRAADDLHALADLVRFRAGGGASAAERQATAEACWKAWDARGPLLDPAVGRLDPATERRLDDDLVELAVAGADLRVRLAPPDRLDDAQKQAARTLAEAQAALGRRMAIDLQRLALDGQPAPDAASVEHSGADDWYALGRAAYRDREVDHTRLVVAADAFRQAVDLRPDWFWAHVYRGLCAYDLGRHDEAVAAFGAALALQPGSAECRFNRGLALEALDRVDEAARDYRRALELDPRLWAAALNRGVLALNAEPPRAADAAADFRRALAAAGPRPDREAEGRIRFHLALAELKLGDLRAAREDARRAAALRYPKGDELDQRLGRTGP